VQVLPDGYIGTGISYEKVVNKNGLVSVVLPAMITFRSNEFAVSDSVQYIDRVFYVEPEGGDPKMLPAVKLQIINDIDNINTAEGEFNKTRVFDYIVFGQILKEGSSERCPITVLVQINKTNLEDVLKERILNTIKELNGRLATGTTHPIVYIPTIRDIDLDILLYELEIFF
jgi:hypothetical protein